MGPFTSSHQSEAVIETIVYLQSLVGVHFEVLIRSEQQSVQL